MAIILNSQPDMEVVGECSILQAYARQAELAVWPDSTAAEHLAATQKLIVFSRFTGEKGRSMLRDVSEGIHSEVDCTRVRAWAEVTLPKIYMRLVDSLCKLDLEERPLLAETPSPDSKVFYTRRERTWITVRMVIPEARLPLMEVTVLGFTSDCGIKICFDRWLQYSCHESHFALVLEPRREGRMIVVAEKSVNSPFNKDVLDLEDIAESLKSRFFTSLSMGGVPIAGQTGKAAGPAALLQN